jgi:hypothetical protein
MQQLSNIARRQIISYPLITILNGFALKVGMESVHLIIVKHGFNIPLETLILPLIFFITIFRFLLGNILHMREIEDYPKTPATIWFCDLVVVIIESMLFVLMAYFIYDNSQHFYPFLLTICLVDAIWIFSMFPQWKKGTRPELPWAWGTLNLLSGLYLIFLLFGNLPFEPLSREGFLATLGVFTIAFVIDVFYLDYYRVLRKVP